MVCGGDRQLYNHSKRRAFMILLVHDKYVSWFSRSCRSEGIVKLACTVCMYTGVR
jgi:hypothetical protein